MKKLYISILFLLSYSFINAQIPTPGFESWSGGYPVGWSGSTGGTITQDAVSHAGTYAARGTVVGTTTPNLTTPPLFANMFSTPGYNNLDFWYKCNLVSADLVLVTAKFYNSLGNQVASVTFANGTITSNASSWTHASLPITFTGSGVVKAYISFTCQYTLGGGVHAGTYFVVDDVSFTNLVGVPDINENIKMQVFPNPVHDNLRIRVEAEGNKSMQLKLTDVLGRVVIQRPSSAPVNGTMEDVLNVESFSPGLYFLTLVSDKKSLVRRVVVE